MKRFCSAVLCLCLLAALVLPAAATEPNFSDKDQVQHWEQVCMLYDLGLISGYGNGKFAPTESMTRAEAARIVALILDANISSVDECQFADMQGHWACSYVQFCAEQGLFTGFTDGTFQPDRDITARELAKVLLVTIGCDSSRYVGANWAAAVDADAEELGLYDGFSGVLEEAITRDEACMIIFNALNCYAVEEDETGKRSYATDQLLNPITVLERRFGVVRYEQVIVANEYADLTEAGSHLEAGFTKIYGHREFAVSTDLSMLGRWMGIYVLDSFIVGLPYYSETEFVATYSSVAEMETALAENGLSLSKEAQFYVNCSAVEKSTVLALEGPVEITAIDHEGDGQVDMVLAIAYVEATVLEADATTLLLQTDVAALQLQATASEEAEEAEEAEATEAAANAAEEQTLCLTQEEIITSLTALESGEVLWIAYIGGRYYVNLPQ